MAELFTPEHYLKTGYEDVGYKSPELSSSSEYPDYIKEEVETSIKEIQEHQSYDTATIAFLTDIHLSHTYNHQIRFKRTINAYKEIAKRVHIDKFILGGDYTNEGCKEYKLDRFRDLRAHFAGIDYYPVNGNHDDGTIWDQGYIKAEKSTNHLSHEDMYKVFYNHLPYIGGELDKKNPSLYYLVNDNARKIRYICLDSNDVPYIYDENGKLKYGGQHLFCYSQAQLDWLTNTALKFDEEGWSVIFVMHGSGRPKIEKDMEKNIFRRTYIIMDIMDAYKEGVKISGTYYDDNEDLKVTVDADFGEGTRADIIAVIAGDRHVDRHYYTTGGIPYIFRENSVTYYPPEYPEKKPWKILREDGNKTEMALDVMVINKTERKIYITRVGAGENEVIEY